MPGRDFYWSGIWIAVLAATLALSAVAATGWWVTLRAVARRIKTGGW